MGLCLFNHWLEDEVCNTEPGPVKITTIEKNYSYKKYIDFKGKITTEVKGATKYETWQNPK